MRQDPGDLLLKVDGKKIVGAAPLGLLGSSGSQVEVLPPSLLPSSPSPSHCSGFRVSDVVSADHSHLDRFLSGLFHV